MTNEEAIARIKEHKIIHKMNEHRAIYISEALDMAIKALEQQPILDKIREEIEEWQGDIRDNEYDADKFDFVFEQIYEIIDEHKKESDKESDNNDD